MILYHGGRLEGPVTLRTTSKSMAYGPAFYLTTSYWTARSYRGGNGLVYRVTIDEPLRWSDQVRLNPAQVSAFLWSVSGLKKRKQVVELLTKMGSRRPDGTVSFVGVLNVLDEFKSYGPGIGQEVATALVAFGCDATFVGNATGNGEDWVALHNVKKVLSVEPVKGESPDMPRLVGR